MNGWLAIALNDTSTFEGFHDWHQDGPPDLGRNHKAFVLVSKNGSTSRDGGRAGGRAAAGAQQRGCSADSGSSPNVTCMQRRCRGGRGVSGSSDRGGHER